jgi:Rap1a immunity proteins
MASALSANRTADSLFWDLMGIIMYRVVLLCCLLLATTVKAAETGPYVTVSALVRLCDSNDREQEFFCRGYLSGLTDTIEDIRRINKSAPCITRPIQVEELKGIVLTYLRTHVHDDATSANKPAVSMASIAIGQAWCPSQ